MSGASFEVTATRLLGEGVFLRLEEVRLRGAGGRELVRDVVRHPGGVAVLPVDGDRVWMIRQHRVAMGRHMDEIPAGKLDQEGEDVAAAAHRELVEELGATAHHMEHLATMAPSPGYTDEVIQIYLAEGLEFEDRRPHGAEEHDATVHSVAIADALDSIGRGDISDAKTLVALLEWNRRKG